MNSSQTEVVEIAFANVDDAVGCLLYFTDEVKWVHANEVSHVLESERAKRLLEFRLYGQHAEFHATRSTLEKDFHVSLLKDADFHGEFGFFEDDIQRLDINTKRSSGKQYQSIAGGTYTLPVADARTIRLRNFYTYDADGIARFVGFRIVRINDSDGGDEDA